VVDILGHLAMGLLWAIPAWFLWDGLVSVAFIGGTTVAALLPDVDLWIQRLAPALIHHHGFTHTVVFVVAVSLAAGGLVAAAFAGPLGRWVPGDRYTSDHSFALAFLAVLVGGCSHLFADMLSAPDIAQPIEPFWPLFDKPVAFELIWYNAPLWNVGLFIVAVLIHLVLASIIEPLDHPYRIHR